VDTPFPDLCEELVRRAVTLALVAVGAGGDHVGKILGSTTGTRHEVILDRGLVTAVKAAGDSGGVARLVEHDLAALALGTGRSACAGQAFVSPLTLTTAMSRTTALTAPTAADETGEFHRHQRHRLATDERQWAALGKAIPLARACNCMIREASDGSLLLIGRASKSPAFRTADTSY
jgi:hypothetical protein